jgi:hypothetical protein
MADLTPTNSFYQVYYIVPSMECIGLVNWNSEGQMIERVLGSWVPIPEDDASFDQTMVDRMSEEVLPVFDEKDIRDEKIFKADLDPYAIPFVFDSE